ncbi:hypothetical protein BC567DRAFT_238270 [Phyllosticta citribraziliensis]
MESQHRTGVYCSLERGNFSCVFLGGFSTCSVFFLMMSWEAFWVLMQKESGGGFLIP